MNLSAELFRKAKATLLIALLAGAEVRQVQRNPRFNTSLSPTARAFAVSDDYGKSDTVVGLGSGSRYLVEALVADTGLVEQWKLLLKPIRSMTANSHKKDQARACAQAITKMLDPNFQEHAIRVADLIEAMMANSSLQVQANMFTKPHTAEQLEAFMDSDQADSSFWERAEHVLEQIWLMVADFSSQEKLADLFIKPIVEETANALFNWVQQVGCQTNLELKTSHMHPADLDKVMLGKLSKAEDNSDSPSLRRPLPPLKRPTLREKAGTVVRVFGNVAGLDDDESDEKAAEDTESGVGKKTLAPKTVSPSEQNLDLAKAVFNLIQNMLGSGVLSIPAGIAAIGGQPKLLLPASLTLVALGAMSSTTFLKVGQQCGFHSVGKYHEAWERCVGKRSKRLVMIIAVTYSVLACLGYAIIIGDFFSALARGGILGSLLECSRFARHRRTWILGFTILLLLPLACLKNLSALAFTSFLGNMAMVYTAVFMIIRYLDGSYLPGGRFYDAVPIKPSIDTSTFGGAFRMYFARAPTLVLMLQCGTAFSPHSNAPAYFQTTGRDKTKFRLVTFLGYGLAILIQLSIAISGFLTFGSTTAGVVLNSYAESDKLAAAARVLDGFSLVFSYPVMLAGLKPPLKEALNTCKPVRQMIEKYYRLDPNVVIAIFCVNVVTILSLVIDDAAMVSAIRGAACASALVYIFPPIMCLKNPLPSVNNPIATAGNIGLIVFGCLLGVLGLCEIIKMSLA